MNVSTLMEVRMVMLCALIALVSACGAPTSPTSNMRTFTFEFTDGAQGWTGGFSDYLTLTSQQAMALVAEVRPLPSPLDQARRAPFLSGNNLSEDLFMFYKKQVVGLEPGAVYDAAFTVQIATDTPYGCFGIGSSPGEGVYVKAGGSMVEPVVVVADSRYVMNIDKGNHSRSGSAAVTIGNMANSISCDVPLGVGIPYVWELKDLASAPATVRVQAAPDGSAWLLVGTDSTSGGRTQVYYTRVSATFQRAE